MLKTCLFVICLLASSVCARADLVVAIQDANLATNGAGFVDVLINSTSNEFLTLTSFEFQIFFSPNVNGSLEFLQDPNPTSFSPPNYVFGPATGNYGDSLLNSTSIFGGDIYEAGITSVPVTGATKTLVRLYLQHTAVGLPANAVGDTFTIGLNPAGANDFSFWDDKGDADPGNDDYTSLTITPSSFTSFGTITITSAAAVPEPGTLVVLSLAAAGFCGHRLRRKKSATVSANE